MAEPAKRKRLPLSEHARKKKRVSDQQRSKTRVCLGRAFAEWRELKEKKAFKSDADFALLLLNLYKSTEKRPPPSAAGLSDRAEVKVEEEWDNSNPGETSAQPTGASIEMEWNPNEEAMSVSEEDQVVSEEDESGSGKDPSVSGEDELSEEDVNYHDDSDDGDYCPPINVQPGDGLKTSVHKFRDRPTADDQGKSECEDAEEKREATSNEAGEDDDGGEQMNPTEIEDKSTAAQVEPVDKQNSHEKPSKQTPENPDHQERPRRHKICDCPTCGKVFSDNCSLRRHLVIHSGDRPYKCFICARGFTQSGNLKTHMKVHKGEVPEWTLIQEKKAPNVYHVKAHVCGDCGMDFPDQRQLEEHRESHKRPYECSDCGKSYKNEAYFKAHQRMHSGEVNFTCSKCGKRWPTIESLLNHESTHIKKKNFHCKQCGKAFSKRFSLKNHLKAHLGERKYLCTVCGKTFSRAHVLKVHVRVHTGEKPYTCDKCGKGFYYLQGIQQHLQIHDKKPKAPTKPLGRPKQLLLEVNS